MTRAIIIIFLWDCWGLMGSPSDPRGRTSHPITIGVGTFSRGDDYGPVYIARHFGWFEGRLKVSASTKKFSIWS